MSQTSYPLTLSKGLAGQRADNGDIDALSFLYADVQQVSTEVVGGTPTAGAYTITINGIDVTFTRVAETTAQITDALALLIEAEPTLANVVTAVSDTVDTITITAVHEGTPFTLAESAPGPGTLVGALVTSSIVADLNLGVFVKRVAGTDRNAVQLETGDAITAVVGIVERPIGKLENSGQGGVLGDVSVDAYDSGSMISVGRRGRWLVEVEDAVTPATTPHVRITATGTEKFGALRSDVDGGDAIDASSILRFLDSAAAGGLATVEVRIS